MSGNNTFVFSAKRRGSNTPVVCKFFSDQESFRREMKFFERVHTGDFVPGQRSMLVTPHGCILSTDYTVDLRAIFAKRLCNGGMMTTPSTLTCCTEPQLCRCFALHLHRDATLR